MTDQDTNQLHQQYTVDRSNVENLRVLVLPEADVNRLKAMLSEEIRISEGDVQYYKFLISRTEDEENLKRYKNAVSKFKQRVKNLANLQYALKYENMTITEIKHALAMKNNG